MRHRSFARLRRWVDDQGTSAWKTRIQVGWIAFAASATALAASGFDVKNTERRGLVLLASALAVIVFLVISITLLFARTDIDGSAREVLVVAFTASIFVAASSQSIGVNTPAAASLIGSVAIALVAIMSNEHIERGILALTMMMGLPSAMAATGLAVHAALVLKPRFDDNILFFPTTLGAFGGMVVGLVFARFLFANGDKFRSGLFGWQWIVLALYALAAVCLAMKEPHGWAEEPAPAWVSGAAAVLWSVVVLLPLISILVWRWRVGEKSARAAGVERLWKERWLIGGSAACLGLVYALLLSALRAVGAADSDRYHFQSSVVVEVSSAVAVAAGAVVALRRFDRLVEPHATSNGC